MVGSGLPPLRWPSYSAISSGFALAAIMRLAQVWQSAWNVVPSRSASSTGGRKDASKREPRAAPLRVVKTRPVSLGVRDEKLFAQELLRFVREPYLPGPPSLRHTNDRAGCEINLLVRKRVPARRAASRSGRQGNDSMHVRIEVSGEHFDVLPSEEADLLLGRPTPTLQSVDATPVSSPSYMETGDRVLKGRRLPGGVLGASASA